MDRKLQIYEIIIKFVYMIFASVALVFVIKNLFLVFPLFKVYSYDEIQLVDAISKTAFANIYIDLGVVEKIDFSVVKNVVASFVFHMETITIIFLLLTLAMTFLYFMFVKWDLIRSYLKVSLLVSLSYLLKNIFFGLLIMICFRNDLPSLCLGMLLASISYTIFSMIEMFFLSLWIIKFIYNITDDLNELKVL